MVPGMGVPAHQATTRHLGAAYPFASEAGLGGRGVLIGRDLLGGAFVYDPFELYRAGVLTNPNMVVFGQIGRGKSAFVKTYLWRQAVFGRRAWVVDPKGEYAPLARAWGIEPVALRPGGRVRLNPARRPAGPGRIRRATTSPVAGPSCSPPWPPPAWVGRWRPPNARPSSWRWPTCRAPPVVAAGLAQHHAAPRRRRAAGSERTVGPRRAHHGRGAGRRRPSRGPGAASPGGRRPPGHVRRPHHRRASSLSGPLVVLDLSAVYHSPALGVIMTCATAWFQAAVAGLGRHDGPTPIRRGRGRGRRSVGHPGQSRRGPVAPVQLEAVPGLGRVEHRRSPPAVRPHVGRGRRFRTGRVGPGPVGRFRDPGHLRPAPR